MQRQASNSANLTGIPSGTKEKFEEKSGFSFDDVRVYYNSNKPVSVQALAYTQGNNVYMGPGQEKHLEHELGHVVQQKAGMVQATTEVNGIAVNDDPMLEKQANYIALESFSGNEVNQMSTSVNAPIQGKMVCQRKIIANKFNMVGEDHESSKDVRLEEKFFFRKKYNLVKYYTEFDFMSIYGNKAKFYDSVGYRIGSSLYIIETRMRGLYDNNKDYVSDAEYLINQSRQYCIDDAKQFLMQNNNDINKLNEKDNKLYESILELECDLGELELLWKLYSESKIEDNIYYQKIFDVLTRLQKMKEEYIERTGESTDMALANRSLSMYTAALQFQDYPIVWKVGDNHIRHLETSYKKENPKFGLTNMDDFITEFKSFNEVITETGDMEWKYLLIQINNVLNYIKTDENKKNIMEDYSKQASLIEEIKKISTYFHFYGVEIFIDFNKDLDLLINSIKERKVKLTKEKGLLEIENTLIKINTFVNKQLEK